MKRDSRLSGVLHLLLHMAELNEPMRSEDLAPAMQTNPVVVRRLMAGLREAGYVHSDKGRGGGWTLTCDLAQVTLLDIYRALGSPTLLSMGSKTEAPDCLIEQAVNAALGERYREAESLLLARFGEVTLAELASDVRARARKRRSSIQHRTRQH